MTKELSDDEIVKKVISGDKEEFGVIVDRYEAALNRYARSIVFSEAVAADVVQEAFIKAYVNLRSYKAGKKFSSWIYRITHNEAISYIRKHRRETVTDDETWFDRIADDRKTTAEILDEDYDKTLLAAALSRLKPKYREILVLNYFEHKSYEEISEILRVPTGTVGTRLNRAKKQLKEEIERSENE